MCVCVCVNHLKRCKTSTFDFILSVLFALFHVKQGDHPCTVSDGPTKRSSEAATVHADITADHRDVPAFSCPCFAMGRG